MYTDEKTKGKSECGKNFNLDNYMTIVPRSDFSIEPVEHPITFLFYVKNIAITYSFKTFLRAFLISIIRRCTVFWLVIGPICL